MKKWVWIREDRYPTQSVSVGRSLQPRTTNRRGAVVEHVVDDVD